MENMAVRTWQQILIQVWYWSLQESNRQAAAIPSAGKPDPLVLSSFALGVSDYYWTALPASSMPHLLLPE
jgi:hypothetical protein